MFDHLSVTCMYEVILKFPPFSQDPNKIDLVGKLVRGMRVEDVLSQLRVTDKQAAKTMYQVIQRFCTLFA